MTGLVSSLPVYGRIVLRYLISLDQERDRLDIEDSEDIMRKRSRCRSAALLNHLGMMTSKRLMYLETLSHHFLAACLATRQSPPVEKLGVRWAYGTL
jgi:hypothetical protein